MADDHGVLTRLPLRRQGNAVRRKHWTDLPPGLTTSGLRVGQWKLITYVNGDAELYDLARDPSELSSVYGDPRYASIQAELTRLWEQYKDCKDAACRATMPADLQQSPATLAQEFRHAMAEKRTYYDR